MESHMKDRLQRVALGALCVALTGSGLVCWTELLRRAELGAQPS